MNEALLKKFFYAGYNRGCYAASIIQGRPIDRFDTFEEFYAKYKNSLDEELTEQWMDSQELEEEWNKLDGKDFNQPLDKPIIL